MGEILSKQMSLDVSYHTDTISVTIKVVSQAQFWWLLVVLCLPAWASAHFPSAFTPCQEDAPSWRNTACGFLCSQDFIFFHLMKHSACFICRHNYLIVCLSLFCLFVSFFLFFQKPKPKDWHPPGGFILGLWALIIMVFFKTYGIKHMKHIFWIWASRMIALTATLDSLVSSELSLCVLWL